MAATKQKYGAPHRPPDYLQPIRNYFLLGRTGKLVVAAPQGLHQRPPTLVAATRTTFSGTPTDPNQHPHPSTTIDVHLKKTTFFLVFFQHSTSEIESFQLRKPTTEFWNVEHANVDSCSWNTGRKSPGSRRRRLEASAVETRDAIQRPFRCRLLLLLSVVVGGCRCCWLQGRWKGGQKTRPTTEPERRNVRLLQQ